MQIDFSDYSTGAAIATELVNSGPEVRQRLGESLTDPAALATFLRRHGLHDAIADEPAPTEQDRQQVLLLRRRVEAILRAGTEVELVEGANALVTNSGVGPYLDRDQDALAWRWYVGTAARATVADQLAVAIGVGILGAMRALGYERFRDCAASDCTGVFVDTSRAGRRRYCTPELCGNRANVAQYRARHRTHDEAGPRA